MAGKDLCVSPPGCILGEAPRKHFKGENEVTQKQSQPLFNRLLASNKEPDALKGELVSVIDHAMFLELAVEAARAIARENVPDLTVIVDTHTVRHARELASLCSGAQRVVFIPEKPENWPGNTLTETFSGGAAIGGEDHFVVAISGSISLAILGSVSPSDGEGGSAFAGGWTPERSLALAVARGLLAEASLDSGFNIAPPLATDGVNVGIATRLTRFQCRSLAELHHDALMDKGDLYAVMRILKAISARRSTDDVLYIFVEQIARVISARRCSIVRIRGSATHAEVLASHEDRSMRHHNIELAKYPELLAALESREQVVIPDVSEHALTRPLAPTLKKASIHSLLVIPILLLDETMGSLLLRAARSSGNFSPREVNFFEIVAEAAANALERAQLFESIQIANQRLEQLAVTDGLTGLYNHRHVMERFQEEFNRAVRYGSPLSVTMLDVDDFKQVNDTHGHLQGDIILREIAACMRASVRTNDIVARYGGEEFIVIQPETELTGAQSEAERLRENIAQNLFTGLPSGERITVSIGVASFNLESMPRSNDLLGAADLALYRAKNSGKNRVVSNTAEEQR